MSNFKQKAWSATDEALEQLREISKQIGDTNDSATIRYCIRQVFNLLNKKEAV